MDELKKLREEIDQIDISLMEMLSKRLDVVKKIGEYKEKNKLSVVDRAREEMLLQKLYEKGRQYNLDPEIITKIWRNIFDIAYSYEK